MPSTQQGYLVLADLSGYTSYLAGTELEHSQAILTELLELVIERFETQLIIAKLEGDAVFAYTPAEQVKDGPMLLGLLEQTYVAFRDRRDLAHGRTTCTCRACKAIPTLDLKFMLHYGEFFLHKIAGREELVGADVALAHRLMKNSVAEATGWRSYALFSIQGLEKMGLKPKGWFAQTQTYDHLGDVNTLTLNLLNRYQEIVATRHIVVEPHEAHLTLDYDYNAPPPVIWEWFNNPQKRGQWMHSRVLPIFQTAEQMQVGARNHCVHGKDQIVVEDVLDHHPFDYFTVIQTPQGSPASLVMTFAFSPTPKGTHLRLHFLLKMKNGSTVGVKLLCNIIVRFELQRRWKLEEINQLIKAEG